MVQGVLYYTVQSFHGVICVYTPWTTSLMNQFEITNARIYRVSVLSQSIYLVTTKNESICGFTMHLWKNYIRINFHAPLLIEEKSMARVYPGCIFFLNSALKHPIAGYSLEPPHWGSALKRSTSFNLCFKAKIRKVITHSYYSENYHFYGREKSQYIALRMFLVMHLISKINIPYMWQPDHFSVSALNLNPMNNKAVSIMITCPCNEHPFTPHVIW